jgi:serine/threonine-protein phosphatase 2A activator
MLNDITIIKTWKQVNIGLLKMFIGEILGKFAIIQHFIYTPILSIKAVKEVIVNNIEPVHTLPNCCDAIHFPSVIAAKKI